MVLSPSQLMLMLRRCEPHLRRCVARQLCGLHVCDEQADERGRLGVLQLQAHLGCARELRHPLAGLGVVLNDGLHLVLLLLCDGRVAGGQQEAAGLRGLDAQVAFLQSLSALLPGTLSTAWWQRCYMSTCAMHTQEP
jgi:hypothetical protein